MTFKKAGCRIHLTSIILLGIIGFKRRYSYIMAFPSFERLSRVLILLENIQKKLLVGSAIGYRRGTFEKATVWKFKSMPRTNMFKSGCYSGGRIYKILTLCFVIPQEDFLSSIGCLSA